MTNDLVENLKNPQTGLTPREEEFLDLLFDKCQGNVRAAMDDAGFPKSMPTSHITRLLGKHIKERTKEYLVAASSQAALSLVNVLTNPNVPGTNNIISASRDILDRGGVFKEEAVHVTEVRNMFILPAKDSEPLVIDHE